VTASLPSEVQQVFDRFRTTAYATVDRRGQPVCWPATPAYEAGATCIDVRTAPGDRDDGADARVNPKVALLFSDPAGSGVDDAPQVLVQGTADVGEGDVVHVRPERVYVWPGGDATREPQLFDAHMEEVRSGHDEEPAGAHAPAEGGSPKWDERIDELGSTCDAVLSLVAPDGFPFSVRVPISVDGSARRLRIAAGVLGVPVQAGLACVTAEERFQLRGDLVEEEGEWVVVPHQTIAAAENSRDTTLFRER
jgi:Pyridoxamine 5'-phosphate oxidase